MKNKIQINRILKQTRVEGFGLRYCIWVQGCSIRCQGCKNQHMWDSFGGKSIEVATVIQDIQNQKNIEGITFLGGEPLDQTDAVVEILKASKEMGLSTIVFTGYVYEDLQRNKNFEKLFQYTDILIDGPFQQEELDFDRPWVGSKNQRYLFLSNRYEKKDLFIGNFENKYEIRISTNGLIEINGMGKLESLENFLIFDGKVRRDEAD